jgi:hypothetical protein
MNCGHASRGDSFLPTTGVGINTRRGKESKTKQFEFVKPFFRRLFVDLFPESSGGDSE